MLKRVCIGEQWDRILRGWWLMYNDGFNEWVSEARPVSHKVCAICHGSGVCDQCHGEWQGSDACCHFGACLACDGKGWLKK